MHFFIQAIYPSTTSCGTTRNQSSSMCRSRWNTLIRSPQVIPLPLFYDNIYPLNPLTNTLIHSLSSARSHLTEFLRKDINNITDFFGKKGVYVLSNFELFKFITDKYLLVPEGMTNKEDSTTLG